MEQGIEAIGAIESQDNAVDLEDVTSVASQNAGVEQAMSNALSNAVEHAASLPGTNIGAIGSREQLTGAYEGEYGATKDALVSDVEREGANEKVAEDKDNINVVAESMRGLMHELTTWHVTWGIAQTAQKDLTHVLKS